MADRYGDKPFIVERVKASHARLKQRRLSFEREWFRNILFLIGIQWIKWDSTDSRWRKVRLKDWVPTPVTNRFASTGERLVAVLSRIQPNWTFPPASDSPEDIAASQVADKIEEVISEENQVEQLRDDISRWVTWTGNAFALSGVYDTSPRLDLMELAAQQGLDPEAIIQDPGSIEHLVPDPDHRQYTDILSPFEVEADLTIPWISQQPEVLVVNRRDKSYWKKLYGVDVEDDHSGGDPGRNYLESIGYLSADLSSADFGFSRDTKVSRPLGIRAFYQPDDDFPNGLYAVVVGDQLLESEELPATKEGQRYIPIAQYKFDAVPGAFFGRTPMNDLVQKQLQRNRLESMIELITMRMSSPIWLVPDGTIVKNWNVGEPGSQLKYSTLGDKSARPDRIPGEQIPSSLIAWLNKLDSDFEEIAATFEVMKGQAPYSGVPGIVVQQLVEQGMNRFGPAFRNLGEGWRAWMKHQIEFFRTYATAPRLMKILGENSQWKVEKFSAANISGAVDVRIEADSTIPRNDQAEAAKALAAVETGLVDISDPMTRYEVLTELHLQHLMKSMDEDVLAAVRENEEFQQGAAPQVNPFLDNHKVHIAKHRSFAMSEEGKPFLQQILQHITEHNMTMDAEMSGAAPPQEQAPGGAKPEGQDPKKAQEQLTPQAQPDPVVSQVTQ